MTVRLATTAGRDSRSLRRVAASLPAVIAITALGACGGSGGSTSSAQQQAQAQTLQASRTLAGKLQADKVVWSKGIVASYDKCGSGTTHVQYVANQPLEPFSQSLTQSALTARLTSEMTGLGWKLTQEPKPAPDTIFYEIASKGLTGELYINDSGLGLNADLFVNSACFDAGSAAAGLQKAQSTYPAPSPS